ncbi:hypothetical protein HUT06_05815 [Actinomadura sp. NAK00032]|uniref:hypothetical protein n=1 Tax=Actinomadura sp. NAK00032 TaxID=2742128 RepID=UPI0015901DFF|nr:hypothetical protein [Actinomadura sp. NAK00032]QKW33605.1 hypothetical protein HUT06_05815 [Actinomadura sp. NAK00032]
MCGLLYFKTAAQIAYFTSSASALLIPNAWPAVSVIYEGQGDPDQVFHSAMEWWKVNEKLGEAGDTSQQLRSEPTPEDWTGEDREAYNDKLDSYERRCMYSSMHAAAISMSMYGVMAMLMIFITLMCIVAAILLALAIYLIYVAASTMGAGFAAAQAQANIHAGRCYQVLKNVSAVYEKIMKVAAAVLGGFTGLAGVGNVADGGGWRALGDMGEGLFHSVDDIVAGALGKLDQSISAGLMKGRMGGQNLFGWTVPTRSLPRDIRPYIAPLVGIKGIPEVGFTSPWKPDDQQNWGYGAPIGAGSMYPQRQYGDEYVDKTHPDTN